VYVARPVEVAGLSSGTRRCVFTARGHGHQSLEPVHVTDTTPPVAEGDGPVSLRRVVHVGRRDRARRSETNL